MAPQILIPTIKRLRSITALDDLAIPGMEIYNTLIMTPLIMVEVNF
jgi:hypothetical protein